jgi:EVE domain
VSLETIKSDRVLKEMPLVRQSRLSVVPLTKAQFERVLALAETKVRLGVCKGAQESILHVARTKEADAG